MTDTCKKLFNPESSQREFQILDRKIYEHKSYHRVPLRSYYSLIEDQETMTQETLFFQKSRSQFQTKAILNKRKRRRNQFQSQEESQFENLFLGCRDWEIPLPKISLRKKSTMDTQIFDEKESNYFSKSDSKKVQDFVNNQDEKQNFTLDYDQNELFDTDCSQYESELL